MSVMSRHVPVDLEGRRAAVLGAGVAGLAAALALGERGAEVVLLEADDAPQASSADEAFERWTRSRVPQFRHSHAFLARLRKILLAAYPRIYQRLLEEGARELRLLDFPPPTLGPLEPEPGDEDLAAIGCRRTTFEWVLRRYVDSMPWATILSGTRAVGLVAGSGAIPTVRGVRFESGGSRRLTLGADLVVDATGRSSRAPQWLAAIGARCPKEERSPSSILYYTRFYRLRPGVEFPPPPAEAPTLADFGWIKFAIFPADHRTFSITFAAHLAFPRLKVLAHAGAFDHLAGMLPGLAPYVDPAVSAPLAAGGRQVLAMGGLENCRRRFVDAEGRPLACGFFAIGDAAYHTNPLYGRGSTQAFLHASLLGEALDAAAGDPFRAASFLDESAREEIEPFYEASVAADGEASRRVGALRSGFVDWLNDGFFQRGILPASRVDPVVFRAFLRMFYMIETPARALLRPEVVSRALVAWLRGEGFRRRVLPAGPDLETTVAELEEVARIARPGFGDRREPLRA
jgi:2-polyprenyl-6-methoxyphenol hydroxylase-like FAD-dependent oxidoreductase